MARVLSKKRASIEPNCASNGSHVSLKKSLNPWTSNVGRVGKKRSIYKLNPVECTYMKALPSCLKKFFVL